MKKIALVILLFCSGISSSQELMNFYISPNTYTSSNSVMLHTMFYHNYGAGFISSEYAINGNEINFSMCYALSSTTTLTLDKQYFIIDLPENFDEFTLNVSLYTDYNYDSQSCENGSSTNFGTIEFSYPYQPTEKVEISDLAFESYLEYLDFGDGIFDNGLVYNHKIENIISLYPSNTFFYMDGVIESLFSVKHFSSLKTIWCSDQMLSDIDFTYNPYIEMIWCENNPIQSLNVSNNENLKTIWAEFTNLNELDTSNNTSLEELKVSGGSFTNLDLTNNTGLEKLSIDNSQLLTLSLSNNTILKELSVSNAPLTALDLTNNLYLKEINIYNSNLTSIDLSNNLNLIDIYLQDNVFLDTIDISTLTNIENIICFNNSIKEVDLSFNPNLIQVFFLNNNLNYLNIKNGNNENIELVFTINNSNLNCIEVDNASGDQPFDYTIDSQTEFSEECPEPLPFIDLVKTNSKEIQMKVFPNPTSDKLYVASLDTINQLQILNLQGQVILETTKNSQIDVSSLVSGIYFVKGFSGYGSSVKKFIKQ